MAIGHEGFRSVLAAAQGGAGWALERLWDELAPGVAGYFRVQGAAEPDDLTSEVFIGVFGGIGRFAGGEDAFRSWVFTIAHRRLTDERRRRARRPVLELVSDGCPVVGGDVEDDVLRRLATERVRVLCARLSPDQRDVLLLRVVGGLTIDQVAAAVGKSRGAAKASQRRGLATLRRELEQEGVPL
jgi:RNA polymerase sigma-70 factor (ECF subfamily)